MNLADDIDYGAVRCAAVRYLSRWSDRATASLRDDLAQEATLVTWRKRELLRDPRCAEAFARTVVKRLRARALRRMARYAPRGLETCAESELARRDRSTGAGSFQVAEREVGSDLLLDWLDRSVRQLTRDNADLLLDFYAGRSCRELAARMGLDSRAVKSRLHRGRRRLRELLERRALRGLPDSVGPASPVGPANPTDDTNRVRDDLPSQ